jgi:general secretion pathway protein H
VINLHIARQNKGFTLIELLVVLTLISIMIGLFIVNLSSSPQQLTEREIRRLHVVLRDAADEALLQGVELGVSMPSDDSYQIVQFDPEKALWFEPKGESFARYQIPEFISMELTIDNTILSEEQRRQIRRMQKRVANSITPPMILLMSSGESTPYSITFSHRDSHYSGKILSDGITGVELRL